MTRSLACLSLVLVAAISWGVPLGFSLKNTDPTALFCWWAIPIVPEGAVLGSLALAPEGRHPVAPGEKVSATLAEGQMLVGVFVAWTEGLSWRSPLRGGVLLASEVPTQGTLLIDRSGFSASNRGREIVRTAAEWGLTLPSLVLDGQLADWDGIPASLEWGPSFRPLEGPWPAGWPRLKRLQATDRDGVLWLRVTFETSEFPRTGSGSLLLSRPGKVLEIPLDGPESRVWAWSESSEARVAGMRILAANELEAWVPWDRLTLVDRQLWTRLPAEWLLATTGGANEAVRTYRLGSFLWADLP